MPAWIEHLLTLLALPQYSLTTVFVVSFISATLIPLGSEPVVFGLIKLNPELFWPVVLVRWLVQGRPEPRVVFNEKAMEREGRTMAGTDRL